MTHINVLIENFLSSIISERGLSKNTFNAYKSDLNLFFKFTNKSIDEINHDDILRYLEFASKNSAKTNNRMLSCLRAFFNFLISENIISNSPITGIELAKTTRNIPRFLTENQMIELIKVCDMDNDPLRSRLLILLLYSTGMRVSEVLSVRINMIDFDDCTIRIIGKGNKERIVPVDKGVIELIKSLHITDYIFKSHKTGKVITRQRVFQLIKKLGTEIGVTDLSPHKIRHSFATHMLNNGANIFTIQNLLGHSDISTTEIYTHVSDKKLRDTINNCHPMNQK